MNKKEIKALERIFLAEIEGRLPLQSKAKIYDTLAEKGMVQFGQETIKIIDGWGNMVISGWYLTHSGRIEYCQTC